MEAKEIAKKGKQDTDTQLRLFRERIAAAVALVIVVGSFILVGLTLMFVGDAERFTRAKDLLLFVNPILGVAIGYFFNKVTSDARAETAESAAETAQTNAQQATEERIHAVAQVETMRDESTQIKTALEDLTSTAHEMLMLPESAPSGGPGKLGMGGESAPSPEALKTRLAMEAAVERAQKWLGK